jgi:hypothetical protein
MTLAEWDADLAAMTMEELLIRLAALRALSDWPAMKREWGWTGLFLLQRSLEVEIDRRNRRRVG